jgi:hypothetical protein
MASGGGVILLQVSKTDSQYQREIVLTHKPLTSPRNSVERCTLSLLILDVHQKIADVCCVKEGDGANIWDCTSL